MTPLDILALVFGLAVVVGIAFGMTRWSLGKYAELRRVAAASDEAMRHAASALGLEFLPQGGYEHPMVGAIPSFALARGVVDGVPVEARVARNSEGDAARTELSAELPIAAVLPALQGFETAHDRYRLEQEGTTLTLYPTIAKTGSSQFIVYEVVTDPAVLVSLLRELAAQVRNAR